MNLFPIRSLLWSCGLWLGTLAQAADVTPLIPTYLGNFQRNFYGNQAPEKLRILWRTPLGTGETFFKERINRMSGAGWTGQPLLFRENGKLVLIQVSLDHHLRKIDASNGAILWQVKLDDSIKGTPTYFDRGHGDEATRRVLITGSRHGFGIDLRRDPAWSLRGLSFDDGREFWRHNTVLTDSNSRDCDASAVIIGQRAAIPLENGKFLLFSPDPQKSRPFEQWRLPQVDATSMLYQKKDLASHGAELSCESSPTLVDDIAYVAAGCGRIYAKSMKSRFTHWTLDVGGDLESTMPLTNDGCLLLGIEKQFIPGPGGVVKIDPKRKGRDALLWFLPWDDATFYEWQGGIVGSVTCNDAYGPSAAGAGHLACAVSVDGILRLFDHTQLSEKRHPGPLLHLDLPQPKVLDEIRLPMGTISTPIFVKDTILIGYDNGLDLYRITVEGKLRLLDRIVKKMFDATPIVWDGKAYIASRDGYLYCLY
jgi:outer membrane protein assembly factor BamB